jgi:hypothetical protein
MLIWSGPFALLGFPSRGPLVEWSGAYVDGFLGFFWSDKPDEVELLQNAWANLWETALDDAKSAEFIKHRLSQLQPNARSGWVSAGRRARSSS